MQPTRTSNGLSFPVMWNHVAPNMSTLLLLTSLLNQTSDYEKKRDLHSSIQYHIADMVVAVLYNRRPPTCGLQITGYTRGLMESQFEICHSINSASCLPCYVDLISRWECACHAIVIPFPGKRHSLPPLPPCLPQGVNTLMFLPRIMGLVHCPP